jgi:hypothetical protein
MADRRSVEARLFSSPGFPQTHLLGYGSVLSYFLSKFHHLTVII